MARILSVEDDHELQHCVALGLRAEGHEILYAWSGDEGYKKAVSLSPDVVILDLGLPLLDGVQVLTRLREHAEARRIPVIILTGNSDDPRFAESKLRLLGAAEYLTKPFRMDELLRVVKRVLKQRPQPS